MKLTFFFISKTYKLKAQIPGSRHIKFILMLLIGPKKRAFFFFCLLKFWIQLNPPCFNHTFPYIFLGPCRIKIMSSVLFLEDFSLLVGLFDHFWTQTLSFCPFLPQYCPLLTYLYLLVDLLLWAFGVTYTYFPSNFLLVSKACQQFTLPETRGKN